MQTWEPPISDVWNWIDNTHLSQDDDLMFPFALEDYMCERIGRGAPPVVHVWQHPRGVVLGLRDRRLPEAKSAIGRLQEEGYQVIVRHSGGAAVPLDNGVLNLSLILPKPVGQMDYKRDFELLYALIKQVIQQMKPDAPVEKGEIVGSYCPGDYDMSIAGLKFCGIAQRRRVGALCVHAFLLLEGDAVARAARIRRFYDEAAKNAEEGAFPLVNPEVMGSLNRWGVKGNAALWKRQLHAAFAQSLIPWQADDRDRLKIADYAQGIRHRYDRDAP